MLENYTTRERRRGSFKAVLLQNGNCPVQIPFYGFMENVGVLTLATFHLC
jgi:hypothetical protein